MADFDIKGTLTKKDLARGKAKPTKKVQKVASTPVAKTKAIKKDKAKKVSGLKEEKANIQHELKEMPDHLLYKRLAEEFKGRAKGSLENKNYPEAIALYSKAIEAMTGNTDVMTGEEGYVAILFANRSLCKLGMGRALALEAETDADEAIQRDASYVKGYYRKAMASIKLENFESAKETLTAGLVRKPEDKELLTQMENVERHINNNNPKKAEPATEYALYTETEYKIGIEDLKYMMCRDQSAGDVGLDDDDSGQEDRYLARVETALKDNPLIIFEVDLKSRNLLHFACMTQSLALVKLLYRPVLALQEDYKSALPSHYAVRELWVMLMAMDIPLLCCCHIPHRVVH